MSAIYAGPTIKMRVTESMYSEVSAALKFNGREDLSAKWASAWKYGDVIERDEYARYVDLDDHDWNHVARETFAWAITLKSHLRRVVLDTAYTIATGI